MEKIKHVYCTTRFKATLFADIDRRRTELGYPSLVPMMRQLISLDVRTESILTKVTLKERRYWPRPLPSVDVQLRLLPEEHQAMLNRINSLGYRTIAQYGSALFEAELEFRFLETLPENRHLVRSGADTISVKIPDIKNLKT